MKDTSYMPNSSDWHMNLKSQDIICILHGHGAFFFNKWRSEERKKVMPEARYAKDGYFRVNSHCTWRQYCTINEKWTWKCMVGKYYRVNWKTHTCHQIMCTMVTLTGCPSDSSMTRVTQWDDADTNTGELKCQPGKNSWNELTSRLYWDLCFGWR